MACAASTSRRSPAPTRSRSHAEAVSSSTTTRFGSRSGLCAKSSRCRLRTTAVPEPPRRVLPARWRR
jgi:hypothetical protein